MAEKDEDISMGDAIISSILIERRKKNKRWIIELCNMEERTVYMNVNSAYYKQHDTYIGRQSAKELKTAESKKCDRDSVKISAKNYKTEKMTATSGKDILGIIKGDKDNSYVIHFSDSAMVSRAVSRGYITVNGVNIELSEETKQKLKKTDEQAKAAREKAYNEYVMQHEMAVAKQQSEAWKKALGELPEGLKMLLDVNNDKTSEQSGKQKMQYDNALKAYDSASGGVSWSQFEWKTYDTQMTVTLADTAKVGDISMGESIL